MAKYIFFIVFLLIFSSFSSAALLKGSVYDISLEQRHNVIVSVDTNPKQVIIAKDGDYEFTLPPGNYTVKADYYENQLLGLTSEKFILIDNDNGFYKLDLILLPDIESEIIENDFNIEPYDDYFETSTLYGRYAILFLFVVFLVLFYLIYKKFNKNKKHHKKNKHDEKAKEEDSTIVYNVNNSELPIISINLPEETKIDTKDDITFHEKLVKEVIDFIGKQGGSTTQKDIRRNFTSSEAKISLVITELEHKGIIEKIKKGRGNIIVLKSGGKDKVYGTDSEKH